MTKSLANIGPIAVINLKSRLDRKYYIEQLFSLHEITNYKFFEAFDGKAVKTGPHEMSYGEIGCAMSHLLLLKNWLESDLSSPYLIVMEDDISFSSVKFWRWTWQEFIEAINFEYDVIHLTPPFFGEQILKIKKITKDNVPITTTCYLVSRAGAKKILNNKLVDNKIIFDFDDRDNVADHQLIYGASTNSYALPLFTQETTLDTDINFDPSVKEVLIGAKNQIEWLLENSTDPLSNILDFS